MAIDIAHGCKLISLRMIGVLDMIIMLTNANVEHDSKTILLNTDHMMSFFEIELNGVPGTTIYSITKESWRVKETLADIAAMLNIPNNTVNAASTKKTRTVLQAQVLADV